MEKAVVALFSGILVISAILVIASGYTKLNLSKFFKALADFLRGEKTLRVLKIKPALIVALKNNPDLVVRRCRDCLKLEAYVFLNTDRSNRFDPVSQDVDVCLDQRVLLKEVLHSQKVLPVVRAQCHHLKLLSRVQNVHHFLQ